MKILRIYLDTSVIGGCLDNEFANHSQRLFAQILAGKAIGLISPVTIEELEAAPPSVRQVLKEVPAECLEGLSLTEEVVRLADAYLAAHVVPQRFREDALHIAIATVYAADVLVSWNFRHIVNLRRIHQFNAVNMVQGYGLLEIRSPLELFCED